MENEESHALSLPNLLMGEFRQGIFICGLENPTSKLVQVGLRQGLEQPGPTQIRISDEDIYKIYNYTYKYENDYMSTRLI